MNDNYVDKGTKPRLYDDGTRYRVDGRTSKGDFYDVEFAGQNPFDYPEQHGETEDSLLEKIGKAAEESRELVDMGIGTRPGVIVAGPGMMIEPLPGVVVVQVDPTPNLGE